MVRMYAFRGPLVPVSTERYAIGSTVSLMAEEMNDASSGFSQSRQ
jgi:hypothetical protein